MKGTTRNRLKVLSNVAIEYFMSDITLYALINKCDLDIYAEDSFSSDVYSAWKDNGYFLKVKAMNKN